MLFIVSPGIRQVIMAELVPKYRHMSTNQSVECHSEGNVLSDVLLALQQPDPLLPAAEISSHVCLVLPHSTEQQVTLPVPHASRTPLLFPR